MRLSEYMDKYSWSQAELARRAGISTQSVARALAGKEISRRNAEAITGAVNAREKTLGAKNSITAADITGLHITRLRRKKKREPGPEEGKQEG
jgi:transcriptional regulator with XRE-family HTH domain